MRVWECSHHYLTPHTLAFSWINPANPSMKVEAICPKEIVISSGSGQEKKLREMRVNPDDLFKYLFSPTHHHHHHHPLTHCSLCVVVSCVLLAAGSLSTR